MNWVTRHVATAQFSVTLPQIIGKERPRHSSLNGKTYTPPRTKSLEQLIQHKAIKVLGKRFLEKDYEVHLRVSSYRCLAESNPKFWAGRADLSKPDADNILKLVMDALIGVAYRDDSQVTICELRKMPRVPHVAGNRISVVLDYFLETKNENH